MGRSRRPVLGLCPGASRRRCCATTSRPTPTRRQIHLVAPQPDATDDPARNWFDTIDDNTLIIVDEAGKAGTLQLDAVITTALARGASVRLVGDDRQLASISAGGILRDIDATYGALNLTEVVRFKSRAEAQAGLALREGDPAGWRFTPIPPHPRRLRGDIIDEVYRRGPPTTPPATTRDARADQRIASQLNERARLDRLLADAADQRRTSAARSTGNRVRRRVGALRSATSSPPAATSADCASAADVTSSATASGGAWTKSADKAALRVSRLTPDKKPRCPPGTSAPHDARLRLDDRLLPRHDHRDEHHHRHLPHPRRRKLTRQQLYIAIGRATDESHIYIATAETDAHNILTPRATHPNTAIDVLQAS